MGKVRSEFGSNPAQALAQWIYRKVTNHDPLSLMRRTQVHAGRAGGSTYKEEPLYAHGSATKVLYPLQDGRVFAFEVTELTAVQVREQVELGVLLDA